MEEFDSCHFGKHQVLWASANVSIKILTRIPGIDAKFKTPLISSMAAHERTCTHRRCHLLGCSATLLNSLITLAVPEGRIYAARIHSSCLHVTRGYPYPVNMQFYMAKPSRAELQYHATDQALSCLNPSETPAEGKKLPLMHNCRVLPCRFTFAVNTCRGMLHQGISLPAKPAGMLPCSFLVCWVKRLQAAAIPYTSSPFPPATQPWLIPQHWCLSTEDHDWLPTEGSHS